MIAVAINWCVLSYFCMCICLCVYGHVCAGANASVCVGMWKPEVDVMCLLVAFFDCFETGSLNETGAHLSSQIGWPVSPSDPVSSSPLLELQVVPGLSREYEGWTPIPMFVWQALYWLRHRPISLLSYFGPLNYHVLLLFVVIFHQ